MTTSVIGLPLNDPRDPTPEEVAWAAGFFEGEGSIVAAKRRERYYARLTIFQNELQPLERFRTFMGGNIRYVSRQGRPGKDSLVLELSSPLSIRAMRLMYPWLSERRRLQMQVVMLKVEGNLPTQYGTGWAKRRERYGPSGRTA